MCLLMRHPSCGVSSVQARTISLLQTHCFPHIENDERMGGASLNVIIYPWGWGAMTEYSSVIKGYAQYVLSPVQQLADVKTSCLVEEWRLHPDSA